MKDFMKEAQFISVIDTESDSLNIGVTFSIVDYEKECNKQAGYANIQLFNKYRSNSWSELIDNADSISGDILEVIEILSKASDNEYIDGLIAVLDNIQIEEEYRGKGFCKKFTNKIIEQLKFINANYIGLIPARITERGVVQNDKSIIEFYIKNGFKSLSRRVDGNVVMGKSL